MRELEEELKLSRENCLQYQVQLSIAREHLLTLKDVASLEPRHLQAIEAWLEGLEGVEQRRGGEQIERSNKGEMVSSVDLRSQYSALYKYF